MDAMVNDDETYSHAELNDKYGKRGRFFESEIEAISYRNQYRKRHPYRFCVIYPMRDAIMDEQQTEVLSNGEISYKVVGYKQIGFLVSTPE